MKQRNIIGYQLVIEPEELWVIDSPGDPRMHDVCEHIEEAIKRHVDDIKCIVIETLDEDVCEHCGNYWTEDYNDCNACCDAEYYDWCKRVALPYMPVRTE